MTPLLLAAALAAATVSAAGHHLPISSVTVFNDRARVVREGDLPVAGAAKVEVALLPDSAELSSVRLEARGAEVKQVALEHVDSDDFSEPEARRALALLDELDDRIALATREHAALQAELDEVQARHPVAPQPDLRGPAPKLNPGAWTQLAQFLAGTEENLQRRSREAIRRIDDLNRQREKAAADARAIGAGRRRTGTQVIAQLAGNGAAHLTLTYSIRGAAWKPSWQLAFDPASETVTARLDGLVRQTTGEEWTRARLTLSTAVPGAFTALPELRSWRIGERERFQPDERAGENGQGVPEVG